MLRIAHKRISLKKEDLESSEEFLKSRFPEYKRDGEVKEKNKTLFRVPKQRVKEKLRKDFNEFEQKYLFYVG